MRTTKTASIYYLQRSSRNLDRDYIGHNRHRHRHYAWRVGSPLNPKIAKIAANQHNVPLPICIFPSSVNEGRTRRGPNLLSAPWGDAEKSRRASMTSEQQNIPDGGWAGLDGPGAGKQAAGKQKNNIFQIGQCRLITLAPTDQGAQRNIIYTTRKICFFVVSGTTSVASQFGEPKS